MQQERAPHVRQTRDDRRGDFTMAADFCVDDKITPWEDRSEETSKELLFLMAVSETKGHFLSFLKRSWQMLCLVLYIDERQTYGGLFKSAAERVLLRSTAAAGSTDEIQNLKKDGYRL